MPPVPDWMPEPSWSRRWVGEVDVSKLPPLCLPLHSARGEPPPGSHVRLCVVPSVESAVGSSLRVYVPCARGAAPGHQRTQTRRAIVLIVPAVLIALLVVFQYLGPTLWCKTLAAGVISGKTYPSRWVPAWEPCSYPENSRWVPCGSGWSGSGTLPLSYR